MKSNIFNLFGLGKKKFSASISSFIALLIFFLVSKIDKTGYINILIFLSILIITLISANSKEKYLISDPKEVVIDEFLGMYVLLVIANTSSVIICGILFVLFRIFDLIKIWPISSLDKIKSTYSFLIDDLALGIIIGFIYLAAILLF